MADRTRLLLLVPALLAVAACGARVPAGQNAMAAHVLPSTGGDAPGTAPSAAPDSLARLDPCALLSPADRSSAGLTQLGKPKTIGEARACDWTAPATFGVTVTLDGENGLSNLDVSHGTRTKKKVGAHQAVQLADRKATDGTCAVLLGVGRSASVQVDVSNSTFADTPLACTRATTVAGLVEPKLP
ncbi:DUF3558 family protein [Amycolatopsis sp. PS_44_ISF1]|uniref:DUF3558 family protein n=1 Tax=Amycolatopsis sp. PS_44_ISF1 TaxID=2974917 RepID=UPI0028DE8A77|nr:DUF3558 family protein [Amycolatopsis sp. PS_44_ISF1]MDT8914853.1 DUF3558 domain-containing protein [Amycolatopsis sp. PS_44_ISF1]